MITLFGIDDCEKCQAIKIALEQLKEPFVFLDADSDANQKQADYYEVDELPHIVVTDENGNCLSEYVGVQCFEFIESKKGE